MPVLVLLGLYFINYFGAFGALNLGYGEGLSVFAENREKLFIFGRVCVDKILGKENIYTAVQNVFTAGDKVWGGGAGEHYAAFGTLMSTVGEKNLDIARNYKADFIILVHMKVCHI